MKEAEKALYGVFGVFYDLQNTFAVRRNKAHKQTVQKVAPLGLHVLQ